MLVAALIATATAMATELDQTVCSNGSRQAPCSVKLNADNLELRLETGRVLSARLLGRWRVSQQAGGTTRSCNARIDLGDEVVYGFYALAPTQAPT